MPDQIITPPHGTPGNFDFATEISTEVAIPINECFISLGVPTEFFKPSYCSSPNIVEELEQKAAALRALRPSIEAGALTFPPVGAGNLPVPQRIKMLEQEIASVEQAKNAQKAIRPQLFLVETYRLTTRPTARGKGSLPVHTEQFGPGEERSIVISKISTRTTDKTKTSTVMETADTTVANDFNSRVAGVSSKSGSNESTDYRMNANFHGDASVGFGSGEANAQLDVAGGSNGVRSAFSNAVENTLDQQIQQTSTSRTQQVVSQAENTQTGEQRSESRTDTLKNNNQSRAATYAWYPLLVQFHSFLALTDVQVAFRNTDSTKDRQVPLTALDSLLEEVLEPAKMKEVRDAIKISLENVLDFEDEIRNIVEEVPAARNKTMLRLAKHLKTTFVLKNADGEAVRNIAIDGVLLKVISKVIPTGLLTMDISVSQFANA